MGHTGHVAIETRPATEDDVPEMVRHDGVAFGDVWKPDDFDKVRPSLQLERFRVATDRGRLVGLAGSFGFDTTVHGGAQIATGGLTWVGVAVTHRRQGILTRLIAEMIADLRDRGDVLSSLLATEGGIYERFGYGRATVRRRVEIAARSANIRSRFVPEPGSVRLVHGPEVVDLLVRQWEACARSHPGEITRSPERIVAEAALRGDGVVYAFHHDGFAAWRVAQKWPDGLPAHELDLIDFGYTTPEAHVALWHTILSVDLVGSIKSFKVRVDDPLPYLLDDPRQIRTTALDDGAWINVLDAGKCFGARQYGTDDELVVEVGDRRWKIGGAGCSSTRRKADMVTDHPSFSALLLGGVRPSALAAGRRLTARRPDVLRRADAMFCLAPEPYLVTDF